jgi:drug/metabolite transporter (DMT)-like permease
MKTWRGPLWILLFCFMMGIVASCVRWLSADLPVTQVVFWRNFAALIAMLPWASKTWSYTKTITVKIHAYRSLCGVAAMLLWFYTITLLPLADAVVISFTTPMFATLAAVVFLGEVVRWHRWAAIGFGFLGVVIIINPQGSHVMPWIGVLSGLASAVLGAISITLIKHLSGQHPPVLMLSLIASFMLIFSMPLLLLGLQAPSLLQMGLIALMGVTAQIGQYGVIRAFETMESSEASPLDFFRLPFAAGFGYIFFHETVSPSTWIGAAVIFMANFYIIRREHRLKRTQGTPVVKM